MRGATRQVILPCLLFAALLAGCNTGGREWVGSVSSGAGLLGDAPPFLDPNKSGTGNGALGDRSTRPRGFTEHGSDANRRNADDTSPAISSSGDISLNFVNVDVQEFARVVFDEILKESVVIDPTIQGKITVRTAEPVSRKAALEIVRSALETHGIRLTRSGNVYRIAGRNNAGSGGISSNVRSVRLTSITAEQARTALQPFTNNQVQISAGADGRSLLLSGAPGDVDGLVQVLGALDVDQLRSVSFALIPLKEAGASAVSQELKQMFGASNIQVIPIQRINGVLITTHSKSTLARAQAWVRRLDQSGKDSRRVHVYQLQNRRAAEIAQILQGMFGATSNATSDAPADRNPVAPGLSPSLTRAGSGSAGAAQPPVRSASVANRTTGGYADPPVDPESTVPTGISQGQSRNSGSSDVSIRADVATNSVVVIAKPDDYRLVETAIRRLDILPSQVLIEATIVEVGLNDALRHGVRWFLQNGNHAGSLTDSPAGSLSAVFPGFNYTFSAGNARLVVNALEKVTDVEVVSSPALTVLDNQAATLKIGDQVPVATRSARSVTNPDAPIVNDIEMKDTGIILSVTPRVNASGLVMLDISQEASDVVPTTSSGINSPTIRQRKVNSSVAVQSGNEIVLGGIISRKREKSKEGIPGLMHIPIIGNAFTSLATNEKARTELLIIIRPTVVNSRQDLQILTQEIKARMAGTTSALYR